MNYKEQGTLQVSYLMEILGMPSYTILSTEETVLGFEKMNTWPWAITNFIHMFLIIQNPGREAELMLDCQAENMY